jgi:hypothetical protein
MKCVLKKRYRTGQEQMIENYGEGFWRWLCDTHRDIFTLKELNYPLFGRLGMRTKQDYARIIIQNVVQDSLNVGNTPPIKRIGKTYSFV